LAAKAKPRDGGNKDFEAKQSPPDTRPGEPRPKDTPPRPEDVLPKPDPGRVEDSRPKPLDCTGDNGISAADVRRAQEAWAKYLGRQVEETFEVANGVKMTFVLIPPGKFLMGSPEGEKDRNQSETPHEVTITEPFYLGKTEVTQAQYEPLMGENPSKFKEPDRPVEKVAWEAARDYAVRLTKKRDDRHEYRLPTEAEWEYACRGGRPSSMPFGVGDGRTLCSREANFDGNHPYGDADKGPNLQSTCRVGSFSPNALGLLDMHGNVWEWCADWYGPYPTVAVTNPTGPLTGSYRVLRGGCWRGFGTICRAADRYLLEPNSVTDCKGFRLARSASPSVLVVPRKPDLGRVEYARPNPLDCTGTDGISAGEVQRAQEAWAKYLGRQIEETVAIADGVTMTFVLVPPGRFRMGSPADEKERDGENETLHEVTLTEPFDMGKTEVTQAQYQAITRQNPSGGIHRADMPVEAASWYDARDCAEILMKRRGDGHNYRLPTEAEWEYACRGGRPSSMPFGVGDGRTLSPQDANFGGNFLLQRAGQRGAVCYGPVGSYPPNALGLCDMHGNVWEWCADWYGPYPQGSATNPIGPAQGSRKVVRGGCFIFRLFAYSCG
jgi:formylglycine-generating enzyme required for sulfatase activity